MTVGGRPEIGWVLIFSSSHLVALTLYQFLSVRDGSYLIGASSHVALSGL